MNEEKLLRRSLRNKMKENKKTKGEVLRMAEEREGFGGGAGGFGAGVSGGETDRERQAEVQSLLLRLRQYQAQAEATLQQLNIVNQAIDELNRAIDTIKYLKNLQNGDELIVPIGAGSFIYATLSDINKVIVGIGGGISAEKRPDDAIKHLERRREELQKTQQELTNLMQRIEMEAQRIQARLQEIAGGASTASTTATPPATSGGFGGAV